MRWITFWGIGMLLVWRSGGPNSYGSTIMPGCGEASPGSPSVIPLEPILESRVPLRLPPRVTCLEGTLSFYNCCATLAPLSP